MHFSHLVLCDRREGQSSQERYEQQLAEVRLMDELGYWACWFAEHDTREPSGEGWGRARPGVGQGRCLTG